MYQQYRAEPGTRVKKALRANLLLGIVALVALSPGCSSPVGELNNDDAGTLGLHPSDSTRVRVVATLDFGTYPVFDVIVDVRDGGTAMDALQAVADVETAYGGGFVVRINGAGAPPGTSGTQVASWFYHVNGFMARTGALDYRVHEGDTVHWDYRSWGGNRGISATLGSFPLALLHGYGGVTRPTVVTHERAFEDEAVAIASLLEVRGIGSVLCVPLANLTTEQKESTNLIIVAKGSADPVREIYDNRTNLGLFTDLQDVVLRTYSASGIETGVYDSGTGVVESMQNPWNPSGTGVAQNAVVLVSGTDDEGVRAAVTAVIESGDSMVTWCGAVVRDGTVMPIPTDMS